MALRDFFIFLTVFCLLPFCIARPYIGLLTWSWLGYMNPHRLSWGPAYDFPFAQLVAIATTVGLGWMIIRERRFPTIHWTREVICLLLLWLLFLVTTYFAVLPDEAWPEFQRVSKILLATFLTLILIDDERKMKYLFLVIALSLGFFGLKAGVFSILTGGQRTISGPGGFIGGNNALGLALNMVLPVFYFLARMEKNVWLKRLLQFTFAMTAVTIMFTYSRGAVLGLAVVLSLIGFTFKFRTKMAIAVLLMAALPFAISAVPDQWFERMATIKTYQQDGSAMGRLMAWKTAWMVAVDRPLTGGGFQVGNDLQVAQKFNPEFTSDGIGAHSVYFEVLGENGFIALFVFLMLFIFTLGSLRQVRRAALRNEAENLYCYAKMLEIGLVGYGVTGLFLEMASFDLYYQFVALAVVLKVIARTALQPVSGNARAPVSAAIPGIPPIHGMPREP